MNWATNYSACIRCGTIDRKHQARGLCVNCYSAHFAHHNPEKEKARKHQWYIRHGGRVLAKLQREQRHYSGLRTAVLERDGYCCTVCGSTAKLVVHHKDGRGRGRRYPDNRLENLATMCRGCHVNHHRPHVLKSRKTIQAAHWAGVLKLEQCVVCGTRAKPHLARGMCQCCYMREWRAKLSTV